MNDKRLSRTSCLVLGAAIVLAFYLGVTTPLSTSAAELRCEHHDLTEVDEMQLQRTALKALPTSVHLDELWPCRNPDYARAFVLTRKTRGQDGAKQWWQFTCRRDAWSWRCETPESKKSYETHLPVEGSLHEVDLSFDGEISLERALALTQIALAAYTPKDGLLFCGDKQSDQPDKKDVWSHPAMPKGKTSITVSTDSDGTSQSVSLEDPSVAMSFSVESNDHVEPVASCWNMEIIVD